MVIKVGINGFGRIGRIIFRTCLQNPELQISAVNDPAIDTEYICYLIKFDSTHGKFNGIVTNYEDEIKINDVTVKVFHQKLPTVIPWQTAGVQYVVEASGIFTSLEKASGHLSSNGVRRVIVTAPSIDIPMILIGVNDDMLHSEIKVISCASSTLYCLAPIIKVLQTEYGVAEGFITSIHAMTPSLKPLDGLCLKGKHWRDHRSIHQNIIPATTGACKALGKIIPQVKDKMTGLAFRVPIVNVSVLDISIRLIKNTTLQDIIRKVEKFGQTSMKNIIKICNEEAVSSDFIGDNHSCILDVDSSVQLTPYFLKLICWYENEYSYACRVIDTIFFCEKDFLKSAAIKVTCVKVKASKRLDVVQQTDSCKNTAFKVGCESEIDPKILTNISKLYGFQSNLSSGLLPSKQPLSSHSSRISSCSNRDIKRKNEVFKIWNNDYKISQPTIRQNRSSFFQNCMAFAPPNKENSDCIKAQERLEKVKKEFSKMVNITENLLKKSYSKSISSEKFPSELCNILNEDNFKEKSMENSKMFNKAALENRKNLENHDINGDYNNNFYNINNISIGDNKNDDMCTETSTNNVKNYNKDEAVLTCKENVSKYKSHEVNNPYFSKIILKPPNKCYSNEINENTINIIDNVETNKNEEIAKKTLIFDENINKPMVNNTTDVILKALSTNVQYQCFTNHKNTLCKFYNRIKQHEKSDGQKTTQCKNKSGEVVATQNRNSVNNELCNKDSQNIINYACQSSTSVKESTNINEVPDIYNISSIIDTDTIIEKPEYHTTSLINDIECNDIPEKTENGRREATDERKDVYKEIVDANTYPITPVAIISGETSRCTSSQNIDSFTNNGEINRHKQDIYDKLDSASATDSENSFEIHERKSQVINITDLTNSLEDLARLDKICRIIEISDELSNDLFSTLDNDSNKELKNKKWSFKDLCEKLKLDEFCNKVFGKSSV